MRYPFVYGPSGKGQRSDLVRCAGLMNGSRIAALVTTGIRNLCAGTALSEQSLNNNA